MGAITYDANPQGEASVAAAPGRERGPYSPTSPAELQQRMDNPPQPVVPPMSRAAVEDYADRVIRYFRGNGPRNFDNRVLIPGIEPSLAQGSGNWGEATLERAARNWPEGVNVFGAMDDAQNRARLAFMRNLIGTPQDLANLEAVRDASTTTLRNAAFAPGNTHPVAPTEAVDELKLKQGQTAYAVIKASDVMVGIDE